MTERPDQDEEKVVPLAVPGAAAALPYSVEIWDLARTRPERVLGRAASMVLARAIFEAARSEHLGRRITLRHGTQVVSRTE